jgi:signal peptidase II
VSLRWLWLSALIVAADQTSKWLAVQHLAPHQPLPAVPGFNLTLVYNTGAAFSFLSDASGWQRWFFALLAALVSTFIVFWLSRLPRAQRWLGCALALILGGALGNLWDRLALGHVIDFIDLYYRDWHWPAFNVADSAISVGAVMLLIDALRLGRKRGK